MRSDIALYNRFTERLKRHQAPKLYHSIKEEIILLSSKKITKKKNQEVLFDLFVDILKLFLAKDGEF